MYIVTNRIKMKPGFAEKMAPNFTRPGALQQMEGFIKVEVTVTQNLEDYDELNVNMYWQELEHFEAWKKSDAFHQAHKRPEAGSEESKKESPMLGSELVIAKIASTIEASPAK